ncbi:hypothetical protein Tco_1029618 [Tanacetum coccineum]|uniref:Uncharacterized protein n=1 Tax=Tanacetum coccineum TaxID=301880 RepID=A0ABQ5G5Q7_9ASTR
MCDPVLRRSDNTVMSIHDFLCMPSLEKATVWRSHMSWDSILVKRTRLSQKVSGAGSSGLAAGDGVEQTDDGVSEDASSPAQEVVPAPDTQPLDTDVGTDEIASDGNVDPYFDARVSNTAGDVLERDLLPFVPGPYYIPYPFDEGSKSGSPPYTKDDWEDCMESILVYDINNFTRILMFAGLPLIDSLHQLRLIELVGPHSQVRAFMRASCGDPGQVLPPSFSQISLYLFEGSLRVLSRGGGRGGDSSGGGSSGVEVMMWWGAVRLVVGVGEGVRGGDDDVAMVEEGGWRSDVVADGRKSARGWPDPAMAPEKEREEIEGLTALDQFPTPAETHRLRELSSVELFDQMSRCAQQTQIIKKQGTDLKQQKESTVYANQEVSGLKAELGSLKSKFERGLRMDRTDEEFKGLSQEVVGFIPDAKEKFDRVITAFPDTTFPFLDKPSSVTASLRANTYVQHSTSSPGTFGHTSTPEHLKKKKKFVEKGGPSAA